MEHEKFIQYYEKYLIGDINSMMEKASGESTVNTMAAPITLALFSALDIFGF